MSAWQSINFDTDNEYGKQIIQICLTEFKKNNPLFNVSDSSIAIYASNGAGLYDVENMEGCEFNIAINSIADKLREDAYVGNIDCTINYDHIPVVDVLINKDGAFQTASYRHDYVPSIPEPESDADFDIELTRKEYEHPYKLYDSDPDYKPRYETVIVESDRYEPFAVVKDYRGDKKSAWGEYDENNEEMFHHIYSDRIEEAMNVCKFYDVVDIQDRSSHVLRKEDLSHIDRKLSEAEKSLNYDMPNDQEDSEIYVNIAKDLIDDEEDSIFYHEPEKEDRFNNGYEIRRSYYMDRGGDCTTCVTNSEFCERIEDVFLRLHKIKKDVLTAESVHGLDRSAFSEKDSKLLMETFEEGRDKPYVWEEFKVIDPKGKTVNVSWKQADDYAKRRENQRLINNLVTKGETIEAISQSSGFQKGIPTWSL